MKVSGFTFIRNAVKNDYPVVEAITSILPLCDEFIVMAGNSDDGTRQLIEASKIIGIPIHDHIIIAGWAYTSFAEKGLL